MFFLENVIYPNTWLFYTLINHSSRKFKILFNRNHWQRILLLKYGTQRYNLIVLCHELMFAVKHELQGRKWCTENEVTCMLELLIDTIFVQFGEQIYWVQNAPLLTPFTPMKHSLCINLSDERITEANTFNLTLMMFCQLIIKFAYWSPLIYPTESEREEKTTETNSFL